MKTKMKMNGKIDKNMFGSYLVNTFGRLELVGKHRSGFPPFRHTSDLVIIKF